MMATTVHLHALFLTFLTGSYIVSNRCLLEAAVTRQRRDAANSAAAAPSLTVQCQQCLMQLAPYQQDIGSIASLLNITDDNLDEIYNVFSDSMSCLERNSCVSEDNKDAFDDAKAALDFVRSHSSVSKQHAACMQSVPMLAEVQRCEALSLAGSNRGQVANNAAVCRAAHNVVSCLRSQRVCPADVGKLQSTSYQLMMRSILKQDHNCDIMLQVPTGGTSRTKNCLTLAVIAVVINFVLKRR